MKSAFHFILIVALTSCTSLYLEKPFPDKYIEVRSIPDFTMGTFKMDEKSPFFSVGFKPITEVGDLVGNSDDEWLDYEVIIESSAFGILEIYSRRYITKSKLVAPSEEGFSYDYGYIKYKKGDNLKWIECFISPEHPERLYIDKELNYKIDLTNKAMLSYTEGKRKSALPIAVRKEKKGELLFLNIKDQEESGWMFFIIEKSSIGFNISYISTSEEEQFLNYLESNKVLKEQRRINGNYYLNVTDRVFDKTNIKNETRFIKKIELEEIEKPEVIWRPDHNIDQSNLWHDSAITFEAKSKKRYELLMKAIQANKLNNNARLKLALYHSLNDNYALAKECLEFVATHKTNDIKRYSYYVGLTHYFGDHEEMAGPAFTKAVNEEPDFRLAHLYRGLNTYYKYGDAGIRKKENGKERLKCCSDLEVAYKLDKSDSKNQVYSKLCTFNQHYWEEKITKNTQKLEEFILDSLKEGEYVTHKNQLIRDYTELTQFFKVNEEINNRIFELDLYNIELAVARIGLTELILLDKKNRLSVELYEKLVNQKEGDFQLLYELALTYYYNGSNEKAITCLEKLINARGNRPHYRPALYLLYEVIKRTNNHTKGREILSEIIESKIPVGKLLIESPYLGVFKSPSVNFVKNDTYWGIENDFSSLIYTKNLENKNAAAVWPYLEMGRNLNEESDAVHQKKRERSIQYYNKYLEFYPNDYNALLGKFSSYMFLGAIDKSFFSNCISIGNLIINLHGDNTGQIYHSTGFALRMEGKIEKACSYYLKAAELGYSKDSYNDYCRAIDHFLGEIPSSYDPHETELYIRKGEKVEITASGKVRFGAFAGYAGPEGFPSGYTAYNAVNGSNHGALLCRVGNNGDWYIVGESKEFTSESDGYLYFWINDSDPSNNSGTFSFKLNIYRN